MKGEAEKPVPGRVAEVAKGIRCILAPNPGPMTHWGTNCYLLGSDPVGIVDPGPDMPAHRDAILGAVGPARVAGILVTHAHRDHAALAPALARATGAPVMGFGPADAGRSRVMERAAQMLDLGGGEGVEPGFAPDVALADGARLSLGEVSLTALHTPGHFAGHLAFAIADTVLTGDVVMGWSTTLISPPDGDVRAFLQTAARLRALGAQRFLPGHGGVIDAPMARLDWLVAHRLERERQVIGALAETPATATEIARRIYHGLAPELLPAAARNTLAHLLDLEDRGRVRLDRDSAREARWRLI